MFKRKPQLQIADQKKVALNNLKQLEESLGKIYITPTGLILESRLLEKISDKVQSTTTPATVEELATDFNVSLDAVRNCLAQTSFYSDQSTVYGPKVLESIAAQVPKTPQLSVDFCNKHRVTFKLLQSLRGSVALVGDYVLQQSALDAYKQQLEELLLQSQEPVEIPDSPILDRIISHMQYDGRFDRATRQFTPTVYRNKQRDDLAEKLKQSGKLEASEIPFDAKKFAKRYDFVVIGSGHVVTPAYIQSQTDLARTKLDSVGYFDALELELPIPLDIKGQEPLPGIYLKNSYESKLKSQLCADASKQGEADAVSAGSSGDVNATSNSRKLANQLKPPTTSAIQDQLNALPAKLAKEMAQKFTVPVREAFLAAAASEFDKQIEKAQTLVTARIAAYLNGVLSCKDALRDTLFEEWQAYASENDPAATVVNTIDQAKEYFKAEDEDLVATISQMNTVNTAKLNKAKDGATILHLAVVIYHSSKLFESKAILKCRGKQIPKILKQFEFPECFNQLKSDVTKKADASESIKAVKQAVL